MEGKTKVNSPTVTNVDDSLKELVQEITIDDEMRRGRVVYFKILESRCSFFSKTQSVWTKT